MTKRDRSKFSSPPFELAESRKKPGLEEVAARVLFALRNSSDGTISVLKLVKNSNMERSRVHEVLAILKTLGIVEREPCSVYRWLPSDTQIDDNTTNFMDLEMVLEVGSLQRDLEKGEEELQAAKQELQEKLGSMANSHHVYFTPREIRDLLEYRKGAIKVLSTTDPSAVVSVRGKPTVLAVPATYNGPVTLQIDAPNGEITHFPLRRGD